MLSHAWGQVPTFSRFSALPVAFKLKKSDSVNHLRNDSVNHLKNVVSPRESNFV